MTTPEPRATDAARAGEPFEAGRHKITGRGRLTTDTSYVG